MTEQFSKEYVDFILSDEARVLQEKWNPEEGDHFVALSEYTEVDGDDWPEFEIEVGEINSIHSCWRMEGGTYKTVGAWLPTLWQLIQIIEGAGYIWERDEEEWVLWETENSTFAYAEEWTDGQGDMIAAAHLAVKAVEGKK